jgi:hypothetical protein
VAEPLCVHASSFDWYWQHHQLFPLSIFFICNKKLGERACRDKADQWENLARLDYFPIFTRFTQSAQQNASCSLNELVIGYPKRWHKHAAAADDDKKQTLMKFEHHL